MNVDVLFLGAGASTPFGIPTMKGMVAEFEKTLNPGAEKQLYEQIKYKLTNYKYFDLEALITILQNIPEPDHVIKLLNDPSLHFYIDSLGLGWELSIGGVKSWAGMQDEARHLLDQLKDYLRKACAVVPKEEDFKLYDKLFTIILTNRVPNFGEYIKRDGQKSIQLSVFTTNYDLIMEAYCQSRGIEFNNGERGRDLCILKEESRELWGFPGGGLFKIYKLHGSINWYRNQKGKLRASDRPVKPGERILYGDEIVDEVLLYPVRGLYAYREPFYDLFSDLKETLEKARTCLVIGYSFRDKDIAGLFIDAAEKNPSLRVYLVGLSEDTQETVKEDSLAGFKGIISPIGAKFNHPGIDAVLPSLRLLSE